jgi:hypothetical protein
METPAKYVVDKPLYPAKKTEQILNSAYFACVANTADSMIMAGRLEPGREQELIDEAIAFTEMLIKKVGSHL